LSTDLVSPGAWRDDYLRFEQQASAPYYDFIFDDRSQSDALRAALFDSGVAEFSEPHGKVLVVDGQVRGMIAALSAVELRKCRMKAAYFTVRSPAVAGRDDLIKRFSLAGEALMKLDADDYYLSRIATVPGLNHAAHLMTHCEAAAAASGATRICLEVATLNERALGFYRKHGFEAVDRASVTDADTGRTLDYTHMAKRL